MNSENDTKKHETTGREISETDLKLLKEASGGDERLLQEYIEKRRGGYPVEYLLQRLEFRGREFFVDPSVYITDGELSFLVEVVVGWCQKRKSTRDGGVKIAEIGIGCGSLAVSVLLEEPRVEIVGLEIDANAKRVLDRNLQRYGVAERVEVLVSDLFAEWGERDVPECIYGDPPWGDYDSVYGDDRPIEHYLTMPRHTVFPEGGRTGLHERILEEVGRLGWKTQIFLNCGVLPDEDLKRLCQMVPGNADLLQGPEGIHVLSVQTD